MKKLIGIVVAFFLAGAAVAQPVGQLPSGTVWGNSTAARAPASAATMTGMIDRAISSTQGAVMTRNATSWIGLSPGTAGLPLLSGGAGANLAYGIPALAAGGTGANLTASTGGIVYSGASALAILSGTATARQMVQSGAGAAPSWSTTTWPATSTINRILFSSAANVIGEIATVNGGIINANSSGVPASTITPVLGVPGSSTGTMGFAGITSGTATITPQDAAGTPLLMLPNTSGTFAVGATSPLVLSATTGGLTCPTCVTGTGGAITAGTTTTSGFTSGQALYSNGTTIQAAGITGTLGSFVLSVGPTLTGSPIISSTSAAALSVGANGSTNPALLIDASTVSSATGMSIKSAAAGGGVALAAISSGINENLAIDAKGGGTIQVGGSSTGPILLVRATTMSAALTYGGVTLSNAVTGTGPMVLGASPTITGHMTVEGVTATGATGTGKFVFDVSPTLTTPILGVASATSINKVVITQPATGSTLTILNGKTLTASNTLTLAGTDGTTMTFPATNASIARTDAAQSFTGLQTFSTGITISTAFTATGLVGNSSLAVMGTNTVHGNATAGSASPTNLAMPSCSTAGSALQWTTNTGFGCNTSITAAAVPVGGITGLGTGVATALAINIGSAGSVATATYGTFTPAITFGGAAVGVTYSSQQGVYQQVGKAVTFSLRINLTSKGSSTGLLAITGLPVTSGSVVDSTPEAIQVNNLAATAVTQIQATIGASGTSISMQRYAAGTGTNMTDTDLTDTSVIRISGTYFAP